MHPIQNKWIRRSIIFLFFFYFSLSTAFALDSIEVSGPPFRSRQIEICKGQAYKICQEIETFLGLPSPGKINIILVDTQEEFDRQISAHTEGRAPSWALAVALSSQRVIIIKAYKLDLLINSLPQTLCHEIMHIYLGPLSQKKRLPQFFNEGLAMWFAGEIPSLEGQRMLEMGAKQKTLIPFAFLKNNFPPHSLEANLAYLQSFSFVQYLSRKYGREEMKELLQEMEKGIVFEEALQRIYGASLESLEEEWKFSLSKASWFILLFVETLGFMGFLALLVIVGVVRIYFKNKKIRKRWEDEEKEKDEEEHEHDPPEVH